MNPTQRLLDAVDPPDTIPAITLYQPWATWIAWGWKTIETRVHDRFAGLVGQRIAIHAGKTFDERSPREATPYLWEERRRKADRALTRYPQGAIVCTVDVVGARWLTEADSGAALCRCLHCDRFGIILANVRIIEPPIAWSGARGIWRLPVSALPAEARQ
jgi:hypothetical protein